MPAKEFVVKSYHIEITPERRHLDLGEVKTQGYISAKGSGNAANIWAVQEGSDLPVASATSDSSGHYFAHIFVRPWLFEWFRDLLRNEGPVTCVIISENPNRTFFFTGEEPVGEGEYPHK